MRTTILLITMLLSSNVLICQMRTYAIYDKTGKDLNFEDLVNVSLESELVFFGELHNNSIAHWLQLKMLKSFREATDRQIVVGMEMFESDDQILIDEYLSGVITERNFEEEAKLWSNYKTDYKPIVLFAKENKIPVIATNTPRRYAAMVNSGGFEALNNLTNEAKQLIAPLPLAFDAELPGYKSMTEMSPMQSVKINVENLAKAQALKDATMAHFILKNHKDRGLFFHINGIYHTKNYEGILWYINNQLKGVKITTISTITVSDVNSVDNSELQTADFTICIDSDFSN
ncbi:MAG TPA: ChaN family lipoprotein [Salinivirgaceae bacterium]|nr:ChaN family lipoprotein [Salinivirgaceae bacterium]